MARLSYVIGLVLLIVDPLYACMPYREHFDFGVADIEPALEGTWHAAWTRDGQRHTMRFRLRVQGPPQHTTSRGLVRSAAACGTRTLVRSASACITATFVALEVDPLDAAEQEFTAMLYIGGYSFDGGVLNLWLGGPDDHDAVASAAVSRKGEVEDLFESYPLSTATTPSKVRFDSLWHVKEAFWMPAVER